jgi:hypothetical protein
VFTGSVRAGQDGETSIYGNYPPEFTKENPYADDLARARRALDDSIRRFWEVYSRDPWNYWVVVDAYYGYAEAYRRYNWVLAKYWEWERNQSSFSGRVLTRETPPPVYTTTEGQPRAMGLITDRPVSGATIRLVSGPVIYYGTKPGEAQPAPAAQTPDQPTGMIAPPNMPSRIYLATSNEKGRFVFRNLPRGHYNYTVSKDGFSPVHGAVEVGVARQERDIYLNRHRGFAGVVLTVSKPVWAIIKPMLVKPQTASAVAPVQDAVVASAEDVEQVLGSDARIQPIHRKLIPVEGARVMLRSFNRFPMPLAAGGAPGAAPLDATSGAAASPTTSTPQAPSAGFADPGIVRWPPMPIDPSTTTGGDGKFHFENLPQTSYQVVVEKPGFIPFRAMVTLDRYQTFRRVVIFPLMPGEPMPVPVPMPAQQTDTQGGSLNDPFAR